MVLLTNILLKSKQFRNKTFLDKVRVYVRGGGGGQGHPKYGGQGGRGGHVFVIGTENSTLNRLVKKYPKKRFSSSPGTNSSSRVVFGEPGEDLHIPVPVGIVIKNDAHTVLGEINEVGDKVLVAKGGKGGGPRNGYLGQTGHILSVTLDLKLIADVGLVGFPNAGKSTLLAALSRTSPKIASYPFTTVQPQLGTMLYEDQRQMTVADLPGLIEGAHINVGMGHSFLKHIERTKLLLFVVDVHGFRLGPKYPLRSAFENVLLLNKELEQYKEELVQKPAILAINKIDIEGADDMASHLMEQMEDQEKYLRDVPEEFRPENIIKFQEIVSISAKKKDNTEYLKKRLRELLDLYADIDFDKSHQGHQSRDVVQTRLSEHRGSTIV